MNDALAAIDASWGPSSHSLPVLDLVALMRGRAAGQAVSRADERRLRAIVAAELEAAGLTSLRGDGWTVTAKAATMTQVAQDEWVVTAMATVTVKLEKAKKAPRRRSMRDAIRAALVPVKTSPAVCSALLH